MAGLGVIGTIGIHRAQLTAQWIKQRGQDFGIMDILQRDLCRHDVMVTGSTARCSAIPGASRMAVFPDFPLPFAKDLESRGIDDQVGDLALGWLGRYETLMVLARLLTQV